MTEDMPPLVSTVIPTRNRSNLVGRAVNSVLTQTFANLECIVVIDGPDCLTAGLLSEIRDTRLRLIELPENVGGCEARNVGVRAARGEWIAFLDDDDEWLAFRVEKQLAVLLISKFQVDIVASRFIDRGVDEDILRPSQFISPDEDISDFLWGDVSLLGGITGFPQTSTWLVRKSILMAIPFTKGLKALQDLDWLLHAYRSKRLVAAFVPEPLVIFHNEHARSRVTQAINWRFSYDWAIANRELFTPRSFAAFLVVYCSNPAAQQSEPWRVRLSILRDSIRFGRLTAKLCILYLLYNSFYPLLGKLVSRRARAVLLIRVKELLQRTF